MGVLPLVKTHREELADCSGSTPRSAPCRFPFVELVDLACYRDFARLVGDEEGANRAQAIFSRFDRVLSDEQKVIALLML